MPAKRKQTNKTNTGAKKSKKNPTRVNNSTAVAAAAAPTASLATAITDADSEEDELDSNGNYLLEFLVEELQNEIGGIEAENLQLTANNAKLQTQLNVAQNGNRKAKDFFSQFVKQVEFLFRNLNSALRVAKIPPIEQSLSASSATAAASSELASDQKQQNIQTNGLKSNFNDLILRLQQLDNCGYHLLLAARSPEAFADYLQQVRPATPEQTTSRSLFSTASTSSAAAATSAAIITHSAIFQRLAQPSSATVSATLTTTAQTKAATAISPHSTLKLE